MGIVLGLGLLTKAFFLGITGGIALFLVFTALKRGDWSFVRTAALTIAVALALGGAWYVHEMLSTGSLTGARDVLAAARQGDLGQRMFESFSLPGFLQGMGQIAVSFAWAGTWSFGRFPPIYTLPLILLALLPLLVWLRRLARLPFAAAAPLFIAGPFILGLAYFRLTQMTRTEGAAGTPGWYLHMLAGPLVSCPRSRLAMAARAGRALCLRAGIPRYRLDHAAFALQRLRQQGRHLQVHANRPGRLLHRSRAPGRPRLPAAGRRCPGCGPRMRGGRDILVLRQMACSAPRHGRRGRLEQGRVSSNARYRSSCIPVGMALKWVLGPGRVFSTTGNSTTLYPLR